jgi:hypothetical protein
MKDILVSFVQSITETSIENLRVVTRTQKKENSLHKHESGNALDKTRAIQRSSGNSKIRTSATEVMYTRDTLIEIGL